MKALNNLSYLFLCVPVLVAACTIETTGGSPSGEGGAAALGGKGGTAGAGGASTSSGGRGTTSEGGKTSAEGGSDANSTGGNIGGKPSGSGGKPSGTGGKASGSGGKPAEPPPVSGAAGNGDGLPEAGAPGDDPPATSPERFFFPTPNATNTVAPKVVVDAQGGVHAAYPAYFGGRAYYAYCKSNCSSATAFQVVELDVGSSIGNVSLALTPQGKPRLVLSEFDKAYYAACDAQCGTLAGWTMTPVFDHDNSMEVSGQALAIDTAGRVR
ncbi:MAG TPA: hypothetical protein VFQ35_18120, partial [Polyangiaceae bacterium]|nr:hypothetical protein [Polyangiaceae bacterium]